MIKVGSKVEVLTRPDGVPDGDYPWIPTIGAVLKVDEVDYEESIKQKAYCLEPFGGATLGYWYADDQLKEVL